MERAYLLVIFIQPPTDANAIQKQPNREAERRDHIEDKKNGGIRRRPKLGTLQKFTSEHKTNTNTRRTSRRVKQPCDTHS